MKKTRQSLDPVKTAQAIFRLNAVIWLVFGIISLVRLAGNPTHQTITLISKRNQWLYLIALTVLLGNIILTFTDQFGLFDLITLVIDLILLGIMLVKREQFYI